MIGSAMASSKLFMETNITGRIQRGNSFSLMHSSVIAEEDVEMILGSVFAFVGKLYALIDPYLRHARFQYNAVLFNVGYCLLERNPIERNSYYFGNIEGAQTIVVLPEARVISRDDLNSSQAEIQTFMVRLRRKFNKGS